MPRIPWIVATALIFLNPLLFAQPSGTNTDFFKTKAQKWARNESLYIVDSTSLNFLYEHWPKPQDPYDDRRIDLLDSYATRLPSALSLANDLYLKIDATRSLQRLFLKLNPTQIRLIPDMDRHPYVSYPRSGARQAMKLLVAQRDKYNKQLTQPNLFALAKLAYQAGDWSATQSLIKNISIDPKQKPKQAIFLAIVHAQTSSFEKSRSLLKPLCVDDTIKANMHDVACLTLGRIQAHQGNYTLAEKNLLSLPGDSPYFSEALHQSVWTALYDKRFADSILYITQWLKHSRNHATALSLNRVRASAFLQTGSFNQALQVYEQLATQLRFEVTTLNELNNYYKQDYAHFIRDLHALAVPIPFSPQLSAFLNNNEILHRLVGLYNDKIDLIVANSKTVQALKTIEMYLSRNTLLPVANDLANLQAGLALWQMTTMNIDADHISAPSLPYTSTANSLRSLNSSLNQNLATNLLMRTKLVNNMHNYVGTKRQAFKKMMNNLNQNQANLKTVQTKRDNLRIKLELLRIQFRNSQLPKLRDIALRDKHLSPDFRNRLKSFQNISRLDRSDIQNIVASLRATHARNRHALNQIENKIDSLSRDIVPILLRQYGAFLAFLQNDIRWGRINAAHAQLDDLMHERELLTKQKFGTLDRFNILTDSGKAK